MCLLACGTETPARVELPDLDGRLVEPLGMGAAATVFVFTRSDCPISNRYAPELRRLVAGYGGRGVRFWLVYVDPREPVDAIRTHLRHFELDVPALRDGGHRLVRLVEARVTPEAAVFGPGGELVYRGRIDDRHPELGTMRVQATAHELEDALEAVLRGELGARPSAPAVGCLIEDLR